MRALLLSFVFILSITSLAGANEEVLRMAVDAPYPPFAYNDEKTGELTGFDVDIANAVCRELNMKCDIQAVPFDEIIPAVLAGKIDVGVAGMAKKPEREKLVLFSDKYFRSSSLFIEIPGSVNLEADGLKGKKIAVQSETTQEMYLKEKYGNIAEIVPLKGFNDIIEAVLQKKVDVAFVDGLPGYYQLKTEAGRGLEIVGEPVKLGSGSCMVMRKDMTDIQQKINQAIQDLREKGEYDKINRKYFEFNIY